MMDAIEKRARELLCGECDLDEEDYCEGLPVDSGDALRAIVAALTPPEGYVLVPVEPTDDMLLAAHRADTSRAPITSRYFAMLAARPEVPNVND